MSANDLKRVHPVPDDCDGSAQVKRHKSGTLPSAEASTSEGTAQLGSDMLAAPEYFFSNCLRRVRPYYYTFRTWAKGRWLGRKLSDIMEEEFMRLSKSYVHKAMQLGRVKVNGQAVSVDYVVKNSDRITHRIHRHERPIQDAKLFVVHDDDDLLVVNKPSSWPTHPCGAYHFNTTKAILEQEHGYKNLRILYRLDRNTSGVLMLAKNLKKDQEIKELIRTHSIKKVYLARVRGLFPDTPITCSEPLGKLVHSMGLHVVRPESAGGKNAETRFQRLHTDGHHSVVMCVPTTGHPIDDDYLYTGEVWGPNCGKHGDFGGQSDEQLSVALIEKHSEMHWIIDDSGELLQEPPLDIHLPDSSEDSDAKSLKDENDSGRDPLCSECRLNKRDPPMKYLSMHLHCWRYSADGWTFETELPQWAKDVDLNMSRSIA